MAEFKQEKEEIELQDVILAEKKQLLERRRLLGIEHGVPRGGAVKEGEDKYKEDNWFGIALSGGGIRSATINLGFLKTLHRFGIIKKADYLSSVSGGGYTHSYVQGTTKETGSLDSLFKEKHIEAMRAHGEYLTPGKGSHKIASTLLLVVAVAISWCMSILSPLIAIGMLYYAYSIVAMLLGQNPLEGMGDVLQGWMTAYRTPIIYTTVGIFMLHLLVNVYMNFHLGISKVFNRIEAVLAFVGILFFCLLAIAGFDGTFFGYDGVSTDDGGLISSILFLIILFVFGFYINPNATSLHRFYRKQLSELFLRFSGKSKNIPLKDLFNTDSEKAATHYQAPYPIINTCLNLQNPGGDDRFMGVKANDYFLLSPLYCGSGLTKYKSTSFYDDYRNLTLPAAITISAAAVNPGMGMYSSKALSVLMTLFNARMGCWVSNPLVLKKPYGLIWWPWYFFRELFGRIGSSARMVNISDGGHIENLGAYELLRRGCRLIISVDAGEDKAYQFSDLNNFILRARNQLGLEIRFRKGQAPEDLIRPKPSKVYSEQRYAVADIYQWWANGKIVDEKTQPLSRKVKNFTREEVEGNGPIGTFVYVKSAVVAPLGMPKKPVPPKKEGKVMIPKRKAVKVKDVPKVKYETPKLKAIKVGAFNLDKVEFKKLESDKPKFKHLKFDKPKFVKEKTEKEKYAEDKLKYDTYRYKIYHSDFPHESTSDQFFDEVQWESYYQLGQFIGAEVLGLKYPDDHIVLPPEKGDNMDETELEMEGKAPQLTVEQLVEWFDNPKACPLPIHKISEETVDSSMFESTRGGAKKAAKPVVKEEVKYSM